MAEQANAYTKCLPIPFVHIMQICMKLTRREKELFLAESRQRLKERGWSLSDLARLAGIHQSQLSRILSGNFKTFSSNFMQICIALDLELSKIRTRSRVEQDREAIIDSALAIWDGSTKDREALVCLLNQIAKMRRST